MGVLELKDPVPSYLGGEGAGDKFPLLSRSWAVDAVLGSVPGYRGGSWLDTGGTSRRYTQRD